jgi:eukaryotic-like serine/threonine-protein kinase
MNHLQPGNVFAKDFRVVRIIAQGGMGAVYEAVQLDTDRKVALKLMHPSQLTDPKLRQRFAQEARVSAWIGNEHIVEVYRAGVDEPSHIPWLAMELLEGETLATRLSRYLPSNGLPHADAWRILSQLCKALIAAHDKDVIHRDIKPENVFLENRPRSDAPFTVKMLDFGIAKRISPNSPKQNKTTAIGTPLWMSPEQNEDNELTAAADVWAMGLLCFRMFTGRYYWQSANERDLNLGWLYSELMTDPLEGAQQRAELLGCEMLLPKGFDEWFSRCVTRDLTQRFRNGRAMCDALMKFAPPEFAPYGQSLIDANHPSSGAPVMPSVSMTPSMQEGKTQPIPSSVAPSPAQSGSPVLSAVSLGASTSVPPMMTRLLWVLAAALAVCAAVIGYLLARETPQPPPPQQYTAPPAEVPMTSAPTFQQPNPPVIPNAPVDPRGARVK